MVHPATVAQEVTETEAMAAGTAVHAVLEAEITKVQNLSAAVCSLLVRACVQCPQPQQTPTLLRRLFM